MKKYFFLILIFVPLITTSQTVSIHGQIKNKKGESLHGANIIEAETNQGVSTDSKGHYILKTSIGTKKIKFSFIGYKSEIISLFLKNDTIIDIRLAKNETEINEIEVVAEKDFEKASSITEISAKTINSLPALGGEKDIIKSLLFVPGVQSGSEATTGLFVRGGTNDQNLILLDNIPIYNVSHIFGYMSVFDVDMVKSIEIIKAGFPASYGGKLSSVIKVNMKNGNSPKITGNLSLGIISSKLQLEIPVTKNTYMLASVRRTYIDAVFKLIKTRNNNKSQSGVYPGFYDINFRFVSKFLKKNRLYLNFYTGDDFITAETYNKMSPEVDAIINKTKTGNLIGSLKFEHTISKSGSFNIISGISDYKNYISTEVKRVGDNIFFKTENKLFDFINNINYNFTKKKLKSKIGAEYIIHKYTPYSVKLNKKLINDSILFFNPHELAVYIDNRVTFNKLQINFGLRYTQYILLKPFRFLEPRLSAKYNFNNNFILKTSFTQIHQYNHLLSNLSVGIPQDIWYPVTEKTVPLKAEQFSIGLSKSKILKIIDTGVEIYYKKMSNLIDFSNDATPRLILSNIEKYIETGGTGIATGLELFVKLNTKNIHAAFSYTLSKSNRQFKNINSGKTYPFKYDRRHNISTYINYDIFKKLSVTISWTYLSGAALTLPIGRYYSHESITSGEPYLVLYGNRNEFRMPAYHRLDLAIKYIKEKRHGIRAWVLSIYNVYNRKNAYYVEIYPEYKKNDIGEEIITEPKLWQRSLLPIVPSISYSYKF